MLLVALVSAVLLLVPRTASAGTYTVSACSPTTSSGGWQSVDTFPSGLTVGNMCAGPATGPNEPQGPIDEGSLFAEDSTNTTADIPNGAEAGWSFTAPTGTSIVGLSYYRSLHAHQEPDLIPGLWNGEGMTIESCPATFEDHYECSMLNNQPPMIGVLSTSSLFFGVRCDLLDGGEYCVAAAPGERHAQADLYSANVTLSETASPTIASVSGAGWSGGYLSGEVPLSLSASDYSGIASVEVRSSLGAVLASAPQSCDYYDAVPCPNLSQATVTLNTTAAASDGTQTLVLQATDAAGNVTTVTSQPVTIDNHGPGAPTGLTAILDGAQVVLSWQDPASSPVSLAQGYVQLCQAACGTQLAVGDSGLARIVAPPPGTYTVRLYLTDTAGKSSPTVSVLLTIPPGVSKGEERLHALIDSHGRLYVAGPVPKDVNAVRVCWHSKRGKRALGSRCVTLHVKHGRIAVTFHPSARARRGHIVVFVSYGRRLIVRLTATEAHST